MGKRRYDSLTERSDDRPVDHLDAAMRNIERGEQALQENHIRTAVRASLDASNNLAAAVLRADRRVSAREE